MDWTTILKAQQTDFIQRLKSGDLLHCEKEGQHSELTVISGERLQQLRDFCWDMANKFKQQYDVKNIFFNNMKGKLGEEVVKIRLGDFVTEVDYEKRIGGDGKVNFTLTSDSSIGIQVKARYGNFDKVQWSIDREEIEKDAVLVCILIQEEVSEAQSKYNLILAGFLPTNMIADKYLVGIDELLYPGGLLGYLESLKSSDTIKYISLGHEPVFFEDYKGAIDDWTQVIKINPNYANAYYYRGVIRYELGDKQGAIDDYSQAIKINPNDALIYYKRGFIRSILEDQQGAIDDYSQAIKINPNYHHAYHFRGLTHRKLGNNQNAIDDYTQALKIKPNDKFTYYFRGAARSKLGDKQGAIDDYTQAININPNYANAYYNRGVARAELGDKQGAILDYRKAADIYKKEGNETQYQNAIKQIFKDEG